MLFTPLQISSLISARANLFVIFLALPRLDLSSMKALPKGYLKREISGRVAGVPIWRQKFRNTHTECVCRHLNVHNSKKGLAFDYVKNIKYEEGIANN